MHSEDTPPEEPMDRRSGSHVLYFAAIIVASFVVLFAVILEMPREMRIAVVSGAAAVQILAAIATAFRWRLASSSPVGSTPGTDSIFDDETEERLCALEEAGRFLGASIVPEDVFPLVSERVRELVPFDRLTAYAREGDNLRKLFSANKTAGPSDASSPEPELELALKAFESGSLTTREINADAAPSKSRSEESIAVLPLAMGSEVIAVLAFTTVRKGAYGSREKILLEAVGERIASLVGGAIAYSRQISNALSDPVTGLANERAFQLVLETRIAEAERFKEERPLIILAMDVRGFSHMNSAHGHSTGDRALAFAGEVIQGELRKMDLVARTRADEFLAVLPSAGEETAAAIIGRIAKAFSSQRFPASEDQLITLELHTGFAGFGRDGRSADELIKAARLRRDRTKIGKSNHVILFPTQYPN